MVKIINKRTKGQEEMVGFALIIILVAIILLIFLGFSLNKKPEENIKSNEVENFVNAVLSYTTECRDERNLEFLPIRKLIMDCSQGLLCYGGKSTCEVLEEDLNRITEKSWDMTRYIGYEMKLIKQNRTLIPTIKAGNSSANSKGYLEEIDEIEVIFKAYY